MDKPDLKHLEEVDTELVKADLVLANTNVQVSGTIVLTTDTTVFIPAPTADPRDPLNLPMWHKILIVVVISLWSTVGNSLVSGLGGLLNFYIPIYSAAGKGYDDITHLLTYPALFMGIGNLIGMPLGIAVGRRPVLLAASILMIMSAILCATAKSYEWHLGVRMALGVAAGQSEALVPMITQEIFFLHERGRCIMIQQTIQTVATAVFVLFASPIGAAIGPGWWYGLGAYLSGFAFVLAFFFLPETKYHRPMSAYQETSEASEDGVNAVAVYTQRPPLDPVNFKPRTRLSVMRLVVGKPEWWKARDIFMDTFRLLLLPNIFWAMCLNGLALGVNVAISTTYSAIVSAPPYSWPDRSASYVNCGQIVTSLIAMPLFGHGSDALISWFAGRRGGIHEPEVRLIPLVFPLVVGTFTCILYGQAAQNPDGYHWFVYVFAVAAMWFCFVGANTACITYLLDAYPHQVGPVLVIVCAFRAVISFGVSYGISPFINSAGYDGSFGTFGALVAAIGMLGIPIYIWGKKLRQITGRFTKERSQKSGLVLAFAGSKGREDKTRSW